MSADCGYSPSLEPRADLHVFLRGPRYEAYSELRESRLRRKFRDSYRTGEEETAPVPVPVFVTPPRKQVKFRDLAMTQDSDFVKDVKVSGFAESGGVRGRNRKVSCTVAQSVPDFSSALRKENRRPGREITLTPPPAKKGIMGMGNGLSAKGSKSVGAAEKRVTGAAAARKSYASLEELRGLSVRAANDIYGGVGESGRRILGRRRL